LDEKKKVEVLTDFTHQSVPSDAVDPRVVVSNSFQSLAERDLLRFDDDSIRGSLNELLLAFELVFRNVFEGGGDDVQDLLELGWEVGRESSWERRDKRERAIRFERRVESEEKDDGPFCPMRPMEARSINAFALLRNANMGLRGKSEDE